MSWPVLCHLPPTSSGTLLMVNRPSVSSPHAHLGSIWVQTNWVQSRPLPYGMYTNTLKGVNGYAAHMIAKYMDSIRETRGVNEHGPKFREIVWDPSMLAEGQHLFSNIS